MKIANFNKQNLPSVRAEINTKLAELKALGLDIKMGNISFTNSSFTAKINCRLEGASDPYAEEFNSSGMTYKYKDAIGKAVTFLGGTYTFKGFKPGSRVTRAIIEKGSRMYRVNFSSISDQLI